VAGKKYLCGFADKRLEASLKRFAEQAGQMNVYDGIYLYSESDLDKDFYNHFKNKFNLRGYGYWVWKPQIILQTLSKMDENDLLQYTDIGCHLNKNGIKRLNEYFEMVNQSKTGLLAFDMPWYTEKQWTKGDLFDYFNVRNREDIYPGQIAATVIFIRKCPESIEILNKYSKVFFDNFSLVDDSPSKSDNFEEFQEHRHDQSIWSILVKINKVPCISHSEQYPTDWETQKEYPIWAKRDKVWNENPLKRLLKRLMKKLINKIEKNGT
jgi:hypothetical protein